MNGRSDAALRRGLRFGQIRREFAPTSLYLCERSSPVRLTPHEQVSKSLAVRAPPRSRMRERCSGKATVERHRRRARVEPKTRTKYSAGARAIDFVRISQKAPSGRFKRRPLTSTPTTTISTPAGRAFPLQSSSSAQRLLRATIFPDSKTVYHTSVRMRFMRAPIAQRLSAASINGR
jgi:hypothetical protein